MSYDLEFCVPDDRRPPKRRALREYFARQGWYYEVAKRTADYSNKDTGVYFSFAWRKLDKQPVAELAERGLVCAAFSFNINYFRSHVFAVEASFELDELVNEFDLQVKDPQIDGMGIGHFDRAAFVRGWEAGNALSHRVNMTRLYEQGGSAKSLDMLPAEERGRCWRWNYARMTLATQNDGLQFPRIMLARDGERIRSVVTWSDAAPAALPVFDYALLHRSADDKLTLASFDELEPLLKGSQLMDRPVPHLIVTDDAVLANVADRIANGPPVERKLKGIRDDAVLDVETVVAALEAIKDA